MLKRIINWLTGKVEIPEPVDTSPEKFNSWLQGQISKELKGGDVYYAICIEGRDYVPRIGDMIKLWSSPREAEAERIQYQAGNRDLRLCVRRIRMAYSFTDS